MKNTKIIIEHNGQRYRITPSCVCTSKRACDLFARGVCDDENYDHAFPCDAIMEAFVAAGCACPCGGFKELR